MYLLFILRVFGDACVYLYLYVCVCACVYAYTCVDVSSYMSINEDLSDPTNKVVGV